MRVLVAPDKFKGTLSAWEAARAIASGWSRMRPGDSLEVLPMADGGEGTLETMMAALGGETRRVRVTGPLGDPVDADYGIADRGGAGIAVVEMARASGLGLLHAERRDPLRSTTRGTGELIAAALGNGPQRVVVCIGGSATNDGGAGMAQALGVRLRDPSGNDLGPGGAALLNLATIDISGLDPRLRRTRVAVACDVDSPLTGPSGASAVYGPQKGAGPEEVSLLDRALRHYAAVLNRDLGIAVAEVPGAGAAGGLGAGLIAFLGATLRPGVEVVMEAVGFRERLRASDLLITGEGSFDQQSLRGKTPAGLAGSAREVGIATLVLCGRAEVALDGVQVMALVDRFGSDRAMGETRSALEELAAEAAAAWSPAP